MSLNKFNHSAINHFIEYQQQQFFLPSTANSPYNIDLNKVQLGIIKDGTDISYKKYVDICIQTQINK